MCGKRIIDIWPRVQVVLGFLFLAWPLVTGLWSAWQAKQGISHAEVSYNALETEEVQTLMEEATAYNEGLLKGASSECLKPYARQLMLGDSEMMAYISISCLSLELPVYHGTDDATLMAGVGHVEGSSLPVGTLGGRCVLAAHSGMPSARMFDDIGALEMGDKFVIRTLGESLTYKVIESEVVLPEQTDMLLPQKGRDLVTLVTCTPRGANTHRLLVTGERCEPDEEEELVPKSVVFLNSRTMPLLGGVAMVGVASAAGCASRLCWRVRQSGDV